MWFRFPKRNQEVTISVCFTLQLNPLMNHLLFNLVLHPSLPSLQTPSRSLSSPLISYLLFPLPSPLRIVLGCIVSLSHQREVHFIPAEQLHSQHFRYCEERREREEVSEKKGRA
jgi:hypothetical protein